MAGRDYLLPNKVNTLVCVINWPWIHMHWQFSTHTVLDLTNTRRTFTAHKLLYSNTCSFYSKSRRSFKLALVSDINSEITREELDHYMTTQWNANDFRITSYLWGESTDRRALAIMSETPVGKYIHGDVIKWKHLPRYWPFVRGIHR